MRAVLCKNVPAVRDFRDVICPAAWKNPGFVCVHVAPFPVFPEIFFGFPAFRGRNFGRDFPAGRGKMVAGFIFSSSVCHKTGRFLGNFRSPVGKKRRFLENFCPSDDIKLTVPGEQIRKIRDFFGGGGTDFFRLFFPFLEKMSLIADKLYRVSVVSSRRERFFRRFFSCAQPHVPHVFLTCACFFPFVCTCVRMCAYTRPREIHNVGLFPSVFESIKKRSPATVLFTAVYKKSSKFPQKSIA